MKKIMLTSLIAVFAVAGAASAGTFDSTYRAKAGDLYGQFGTAFTSGLNNDGDSQTNLMSGDFGVTSVNLAYGVTDSFAITFDTPANGLNHSVYAIPELGINWQLLNTESFGLDFVAKYGIAWTEVTGTDERIGNNNFQTGAHIYGKSGAFQWGGRVLGQYVFAEVDDFMNILLQAEAMYSFDAKYAIKGELNYNFIGVSEDVMFYDRSVSFGVVHNFSEIASVMPYIAYHLQDANSEDNTKVQDDFVQIGAKFAVQF